MAPPNVSRVVELDKPATVQCSQYKDTVYMAMRYMYNLPDGSLAFGKNGVNIPIQWFARAVKELLKVYNEATGSTLTLAGENAVSNEQDDFPDDVVG